VTRRPALLGAALLALAAAAAVLLLGVARRGASAVDRHAASARASSLDAALAAAAAEDEQEEVDATQLAAELAAAPRVPRWGVHDVVLRSRTVYDGGGGRPNPFTDLSLHARLRSPSGAVRLVEGFFDGDGAGGQRGNVWRIRLQLDHPGAWRWTTVSDDRSLGRRRGRIVCRGTVAGPFARGPIVRSGADPRRFAHADGPAVLLVGKFLDVAAPPPLQFSHTLLSEELDDADREALLARHRDLGLNKMNVYLANRGDYSAVSTTPWLGSAADPDRRRFDLARWHRYERWIARLGEAGIAAQLWLFADDSGFGDLPEEERELLARTAMARLSAHPNTLLTLVLEWQEGWSRAEVERLARVVADHNPWRRLVSVHGTTGDFAFAGEPWADYLDVQAGNGATHDKVHASSLRHRQLAAKPLIQEEHGLGQEDRRHRQNAWAALMGGAAGIGTGGSLAALARFARELPLEGLAPAGEVVQAGSAYALRGRDDVFAFYLPEGGAIAVELASRPLTGRWYDPRAGSFGSPFAIAGGRTALVPPGGDDWALLVTR
jgi:hypothetical protein